MAHATPSLDRLLAFLLAEAAAGRPFPSPEQMRRHMGWKSTTGVLDCLMRLKIRGLVHVKSRTPQGRSWRYEWAMAEEGE